MTNSTVETEPLFEVAQLSMVELYTPKVNESLECFKSNWDDRSSSRRSRNDLL